MQCPNTALAIVDANSFYASCFAAFDASLAGRPVVVLSNNDGNVIARSREAKTLGIPMGAPFFQIRELVAQHGIAVFSSNHGFFADMSYRFQSLLLNYSPRVEHYSIDEAWLDVAPTKKMSLTDIGREIHRRVHELSGIPVSVGFAETKTLAKVALEYAKTSTKTRGVLDLTHSPYQSIALERLPVANVWGIGPKHTERLNRHDIFSALELRNADDQWVRRNLTIKGLRTAHELRGIQCFPLNPTPPQRKMVTVSRSFGQATDSLQEVRAAVAWFTTRACEKLRREGMLAGKLNVWLETDRFRDTPQFSDSISLNVSPVSYYTPEILHLALRGIERIFRAGYQIRRAGVILSELLPEALAPRRLWEDRRFAGYRRLMQAMDEMNARFGRDAVRCGFFLSAGVWKTKASFYAPSYTTNWGDVLITK